MPANGAALRHGPAWITPYDWPHSAIHVSELESLRGNVSDSGDAWTEFALSRNPFGLADAYASWPGLEPAAAISLRHVGPWISQ